MDRFKYSLALLYLYLATLGLVAAAGARES